MRAGRCAAANGSASGYSDSRGGGGLISRPKRTAESPNFSFTASMPRTSRSRSSAGIAGAGSSGSVAKQVELYRLVVEARHSHAEQAQTDAGGPCGAHQLAGDGQEDALVVAGHRDGAADRLGGEVGEAQLDGHGAPGEPLVPQPLTDLGAEPRERAIDLVRCADIGREGTLVGDGLHGGVIVNIAHVESPSARDESGTVAAEDLLGCGLVERSDVARAYAARATQGARRSSDRCRASREPAGEPGTRPRHPGTRRSARRACRDRSRSSPPTCLPTRPPST